MAIHGARPSLVLRSSGGGEIARLEPGSAAHLPGAAVRIHQKAVCRIRPEALQVRHRFCRVVEHMSLGAGRGAAGIVPTVQGVGGGIPHTQAVRRVLQPGVTLVQVQVFGPELEPFSRLNTPNLPDAALLIL